MLLEFREMMAIHSIFERGLHVPRAHIFVQMGSPGVLQVIVRHQGCELVVDVNTNIQEETHFVRAWRAACREYNALPQLAREEIFQTSEVRDRAVELLALAVSKGMHHPESRAESPAPPERRRGRLKMQLQPNALATRARLAELLAATGRVVAEARSAMRAWEPLRGTIYWGGALEALPNLDLALEQLDRVLDPAPPPPRRPRAWPVCANYPK